MIEYSPTTSLESAVLESGHFELTTDSAGREIVTIGHRRLAKVVVPQKSEGLHDLIEALGADGGRAFSAIAGDPWQIDAEEPETAAVTTAAEEYIVMGLRPMRSDTRPVRVAAGGEVVRLFLLPWHIPAKTLNFNGTPHYVVTATRGVVGDWSINEDGRRGVIVGVPEVWVGILERLCGPGNQLVLRCDVPVPWIGDSGLTNAIPTSVGVFEIPKATPLRGDFAEAGDALGGPIGTWVAKLPVVMAEGDVVNPLEVPGSVEVPRVPDGPWENEFGQDPSDFSNLT